MTKPIIKLERRPKRINIIKAKIEPIIKIIEPKKASPQPKRLILLISWLIGAIIGLKKLIKT